MGTNNDIRNATQKTKLKIGQHENPLKTEVNSGTLEGWKVPAPLVVSVV